MELAQNKTSFKEFASHKATRIMSYIRPLAKVKTASI